MDTTQSSNQNLHDIPLSDVSAVERAQFIKKTYVHLAGAVLAFICIEFLLFQIPFVVNFALSLTGGYSWLIMLGGFMFVTYLAEGWANNSKNKTVQYAGLGLYVLAEAFIFIPLLYIAMFALGDAAIVGKAAIVTLSLFTGLSAVVLITGKDFSFLKSALTVGFMLALGLIVAGIVFGFNLGLYFSFAMVVLAAGSILYQTSQLVHKYHTGQYVAASLGLFASLMLLFWYILQIFLSFSGD